MKRLLTLFIITLMLSGCGLNWEAGFSVGVDLAELRKEREAQGKPHIEDVVFGDEDAED
jgi:Ran GTPase-activating protein (RanGAP) involved in mRNA processing and transport